MALQGKTDTFQRKTCEAGHPGRPIETGQANCREIGYATDEIPSFPVKLFQAIVARGLILGL